MEYPTNNSTENKDISNVLNEPAIFKIAGYMGFLGVFFIIIGAIFFLATMISLITPNDNFAQFKKIGWVFIIYQLFPLLVSIGIIFSGIFLKQSSTRFKNFLYYKNIVELNLGLDFQRKYFLTTVITTITAIISAIVMVILSIAMLGSLMSNYQMLK